MTPGPGWWTWLVATDVTAATVLIRFYVGVVFLTEGILKFVRPHTLGTGRFDKIGIPAPGFFAPFTGVLEIVCGTLLLVGLLTRLAAIPMVVNMTCALIVTKIPILWGGSALFKGESGWGDFLHEARVDLAQLCGSLFLLIVGAGAYSFDACLHHGAAVSGLADADRGWSPAGRRTVGGAVGVSPGRESGGREPGDPGSWSGRRPGPR
ncbi:DoxX family protein [Pseudofrankia saprophytica]|uniref:DoxX family protein n=1 Tax=Pseudofrankia saprophytica TaxID=298655 RepID=UPI0006882529|nr:DoxX family protein [Pseudofrankia saprophytica]OHV31812.1 branched-chain amino acid ABC transporter substrate-binding protein [Pseudofrankia sp. EUN1h]